MLKIINLKGLKFNDAIGIYEYAGRSNYALMDEQGIISLDGGKTAYMPKGGKLALQAIIDGGGFVGEIAHIQPIN